MKAVKVKTGSMIVSRITVGTVLAASKPVDPASDRSKWMILLIAFAGLTAATSGPRRARRATLPI